jgi:hypothetical protein
MQLIWALVVILVVLWLVGFLAHIGGGLVHVLLIIAAVMIVINLMSGRGARL